MDQSLNYIDPPKKTLFNLYHNTKFNSYMHSLSQHSFVFNFGAFSQKCCASDFHSNRHKKYDNTCTFDIT